MQDICFESTFYEINGWQILRLPNEASSKLPSRGMMMIRGTLNGADFEAPLEPDGEGSHWFRVSDKVASEAHAVAGETVAVSIELIKQWQEPEVPEDFKEALTQAGLMARWDGITTRARWEWIRWIRCTSNPATRQKRITVACSKLKDGKNRPCCFDFRQSTEPAVSKSGVLIDPRQENGTA